MSDFLCLIMRRRFERYYIDNIKNQIYKWSNKTLVEWIRDPERNKIQLFNILEELCQNIYQIGYNDGFDDAE